MKMEIPAQRRINEYTQVNTISFKPSHDSNSDTSIGPALGEQVFFSSAEKPQERKVQSHAALEGILLLKLCSLTTTTKISPS